MTNEQVSVGGTENHAAAQDGTAMEKLSLTEKLGYASGDVASCLYWQTFSLFLLNFYTDVFGIGAAAAGTMLLITRIWDTAADPIMGALSDRTRSKHGRFRPWLLWGAGPFALTGVLAFITPPFGDTGKLVYAYVTYSLVMLTYTMVNIPYGALLGVITANSEERTKLSSFRFLGAHGGSLLVQFSLLELVHFLGRGNTQLGYPLAVALYGTAAAVLFVFTFSATKERVAPPVTEQGSVRQNAADLLRNGPWLVLGAMSVLLLVAISLRNAATIYYFKYFVSSEELLKWFWLIGSCCTLVGVALTALITRLLGGKKRTYMTLVAISAATQLAFQFVGPHDTALMFALQIVGSFACGPVFPLTWSMYADTADYAEWKTGRRATGLVFSTATFAQKIGWTVGGSAAGWALAAYGFQANAAQSSATLAGISAMMGWMPAAMSALAVLVAGFYGLNARMMKNLEADLSARRAERESVSEAPRLADADSAALA
jgi:GPH family glycoside/pentoside/hexuronide:cation symporter